LRQRKTAQVEAIAALIRNVVKSGRYRPRARETKVAIRKDHDANDFLSEHKQMCDVAFGASKSYSRACTLENGKVGRAVERHLEYSAGE
jgi:hypothetical protein